MDSYEYVGNCVGSTAEAIDAMVDSARQVTYRTFCRYVLAVEVNDMFPGPPHIKHDWAVSFHKSVYRGRPCYFVCHSAIEFIWCKPTEAR